jgi:hypothetical protein
MLARFTLGENEMLGINDPWIWGAYVACFVTVIFCCAYAWLKKDDDSGDE